MKRYFKLIVMVFFIVFTIGTYYVQQSFAKSQYPHFVIDTKNGDEQEIESLLIDGSYQQDSLWINMVISSEGTKYYDRASIIEQVFSDRYYDSEINRLQKSHRQFMRGKTEDPSKFYEDDQYLIYAFASGNYGAIDYSPGDFTFEIAVLDKQTKDKVSFKLPVPDQHRYFYVNVEDVQLVDDELIVITHNNIRHHESGNLDTEMHIYSFDLAQESLVRDEVIEFPSLEQVNYNFAYIYSLNNENQLGSNPFALFVANIEEEQKHEEHYYTYELVDTIFIAYHFETKEQVVLDLSELIQEGFSPDRMNGHHLYLKKHTDEQVDVIRFNVETGQLEMKQTFDLPPVPAEMFEMYGDYLQSYSLIHQDKLYYVSPLITQNMAGNIFVWSIETGEQLYEGTLTLDPKHQALDDYRVEIFYFQMK